jgi:hypothetical protein
MQAKTSERVRKDPRIHFTGWRHSLMFVDILTHQYLYAHLLVMSPAIQKTTAGSHFPTDRRRKISPPCVLGRN